MSLLDYAYIAIFLVSANSLLLWWHFSSIKYVFSEKWLILYMFYLPLRYIEYKDIESVYKVNGVYKLRFIFVQNSFGNFSKSFFGPSVALKVNKNYYKHYKWICLSPKNPDEFVRLLGEKIEKAGEEKFTSNTRAKASRITRVTLTRISRTAAR